MIRLFLTLSLLVVSIPSLAVGTAVEIDSQLYFEGKKVGAPRILTNLGERAKVLMNDQKQKREYNFEVFPVKIAGSKIRLNYALAVRQDKDETISRGQLDVQEKGRAKISLDHGNIQIHLKIKKS